MSAIAFLLDGPPPTWMFARFFVFTVGGPALVIIGSRQLVNRRKSGFWWTFAMAIASAGAARWSVQPLINWGYPYDPRWVDLWSAVAAALPFVAIVSFRTRSMRSYLFLSSVMIFAWAYFGFGAGDPPARIRQYADVYLRQMDISLAHDPVNRGFVQTLHEELQRYHRYEIEAYDRRITRLEIAGALSTLLLLAATVDLDAIHSLASLRYLTGRKERGDSNRCEAGK